MHPGPGKTTQQFEKDSYDCQRNSRFSTLPIVDRDLYRSCMKGQGQVD